MNDKKNTKRSHKRLFLCTAFMAFAITSFFVTCDMTYIKDAASQGDSKTAGKGGTGRELTESERDFMEQNGRFLKLTHMPPNTQIPNVFSVQVANSASPIAKLHKDNPVCIFRDSDESTVYIPLSYTDDSEFLETGFFYAAFTVHVDAVTKYIVDIADKLLVPFTEGRGQVDVRSLPDKTASLVEPRYLTIFNLPPNLSAFSISNVLIHNQKETVAKCNDYSLLEISIDDYRAVARIPLSYYKIQSVFTETGYYFVSFDINVDAETQYLITRNDNVQVSFINGNGFLDIDNIPQNPIPYLTIMGLPFYTTKNHISNVYVYNLAGQVASCNDYNDVSVFKNNGYVTAMIPLSSSSGSGYFHDTGRFTISFTVNVDVENQILFNKSDNVVLQFTEGSALFDLVSMYGLFNAELTNPDDTDKPRIKANSAFDIDGKKHTVSGDTEIYANPPANPCFMFLYAFRAGEDVYYEFSTIKPVYIPPKKGWYSGSKRALWKMVYDNKSGESDKYLFKTKMTDNFPHFKNSVISKKVFDIFTSGRQPALLLPGDENPPTVVVTLDPGVYAVKLVGAGGEGGAASAPSNKGASSGGEGGYVTEIFSLNKTVTFFAFTGSGGSPGEQGTINGEFNIYGKQNYLETITVTQSGPIYRLINSSTSTKLSAGRAAASGGGGGGGGSGSFLYSPQESPFTNGYLLCAGGGGGGSGASYLTPGGGGGAGGSIGPGGGGGASGSMSQAYPRADNTFVNNLSVSGGAGGAGGGFAVDHLFVANKFAFNGSGKQAYSEASFDMPSSVIDTFYTGDYNIMNYDGLTIFPDFYVTTIHAFSSSKDGAATAAILAPSTQAWLNTKPPEPDGIDANGTGGHAPALASNVISKDLTFFNNDPVYYYSAGDITVVFAGQRIITNSGLKPGVDGAPGGNNRNSNRGGGAAQGEAGSVTVYKIDPQL